MKGPIIYTAVAAMTLQQALSTMGGLTVPLLVPPIAAETGLNPSLVGLYTAFLYGGATISSLIGGGFLLRYGALGLSQVCLLVISLGLLLSLSSSLLLFVFGAIIIGLGLGPATPASSQILARYAKPANAPLMFSIKQTGVPLGGILAGSLLPLCVSSFGWQGAIFVTALMVIILTVLLQPLRAEIARISPAGLVGVVTGGVVFFACLGMMVLPGLLGLILELFSSYRVAFVSLGLIPILVSLTLLRSVLRAKNLRNEI